MKVHDLLATPETVHWGYFDPDLEPVLTVADGDVVRVEAVTHQAGDVPDLLMDDGIARLYDGVTDRGPGPHILTGPVAVEGAEPGDTLEVRILAAEPRLLWGTNLAAHWGYLYRCFDKERVTVYRLDLDAGVARAAFAYDWAATPLADAPGTVVAPDSVTREPALAGVVVPLRPHFGTMGVAPPQPGRQSSIPPGDWGGNVDNWRIGAGATMYYPVGVSRALLSVGDPHVSQGDGEVSGTALEASLNGLLQLRVRRDLDVRSPLLVTPTTWTVHGFGDDLDEAMAAAAERLLQLLVDRQGLSLDDAYSLMSVACDFGVTQVVDGRQGVHATVERRMFVGGGTTPTELERHTFGPEDGVPAPVAPYAHVVRAGPLLFLTGQLPLDPATGALVGDGVAIQTDAVIANLERVLTRCGASLDDVVQARAYLTSMDLYDEFNAAYARYFDGRLPARTCVAVVGLARGALVEIDVVAYCEETSRVGGASL